ncbi:MAG: transglycosylase SLT domain-containing protein [Clostridia bacterium]|nr:transglycosylase SLT domain-containing protein [Clostridia bacterium]
MKNRLTAVVAVIAAVTVLATGAIIAAHRTAVKKRASKPAVTAAQDDSPEIVIMSEKERTAFIKMLAQDPEFLASYAGAKDAEGGEDTSHNIKYANSSRPLPLSYDIALYTIYKAQQNGIDPDLIFCIMWRESNFNPNEISRNSNGSYDYGLMQINSSNFSFLSQKIGITSMYDLLDPYKNIDCGVYYIAAYMRKYGDMNKALMCYNLGEGGAQRKWSQGIYYSSYSKSIIERMGQYYLVENYTMPKSYSQGGAVYYNEDGEEVSDEIPEETETATVIETTTKAKKKEYVPHEKEYQKAEKKTTEPESATEQ